MRTVRVSKLSND